MINFIVRFFSNELVSTKVIRKPWLCNTKSPPPESFGPRTSETLRRTSFCYLNPEKKKTFGKFRNFPKVEATCNFGQLTIWFVTKLTYQSAISKFSIHCLACAGSMKKCSLSVLNFDSYKSILVSS